MLFPALDWINPSQYRWKLWPYYMGALRGVTMLCRKIHFGRKCQKIIIDATLYRAYIGSMAIFAIRCIKQYNGWGY